MEIERKFLVADPPRDLAEHPAEHIEQGYLALDGDVEVRVRRRDGRALLTIKRGGGLVRLEEELAIGRARFARLWELTEGRRLEKVRHRLPHDGLTIELDVYGGDLAGLVVAEVEFASVLDSQDFSAPEWFGEEVTGDERYGNRTLAVAGRPSGRPRNALAEGEDARDGVRRLARTRLDRALGALAVAADGERQGEAVHTARKALKRARTTVRLARDGLGDEVYRRENAAYRDAGRRLSAARDSKVMVETLDMLGAEDFPELDRALRDEHVRVDVSGIDGVVDDLRAARERVAAWSLDGDDLATGFARIYRRGRKALRAAEADGGDEALHELRKRVKDLWYAAEIVAPAAPKRSKKLARRASRLSDEIGDDHDLAVLETTLDRHLDHLTSAQLATLRQRIARRRAALQEDARRHARKLYRRKPGAVVRRLRL